MARSIAEIEGIINDKVAEMLPGLTSTSKAAVWRLWVYIVAFVANLQDQIDDARKVEYMQLLENQRVATLQWYRAISMSYLYGKALVWNEVSQKFEQTLLPDEDAADYTLIDYCAAVPINGGILIKVAKEGVNGGEQLTVAENIAFSEYIHLRKAAGDALTVVNDLGDDLVLELDVYIDATAIDVSTGFTIGTTDEVADAAVRNYLRELEFNGALRLTSLDDAVIAAEGVNDVKRVSVTTRYGSLPYAEIDVQHIPNAGYYNLTSLTINYIA